MALELCYFLKRRYENEFLKLSRAAGKENEKNPCSPVQGSATEISRHPDAPQLCALAWRDYRLTFMKL